MKIKDLPKACPVVKRSLYFGVDRLVGTGHRSRLRDRFLQSGFDGFLNYEIVELLLTLGTPRKDCKQIAKEAIRVFGGLQGVLDASLDDLERIKGIGSSNAFGIKLFRAVSERYAKERIPKKITFDSPELVADFLQKSIGLEKKEHFIALSLDSRNYLIGINNISVGSLNASIVHPREVFKEAVKSSAAYIILAHNHPSGDPSPSGDDFEATKRLIETGKILGIEVIDHIIVTKEEFFSFKEKGLI